MGCSKLNCLVAEVLEAQLLPSHWYVLVAGGCSKLKCLVAEVLEAQLLLVPLSHDIPVGQMGSSKLKDEAELEIDLTGAQESGVRPSAPSPPQESYAQAQSSTEDALSSSRQQGIQSPPVSFAPEEKMDSSLPEPQQEELRTPGLDKCLAWVEVCYVERQGPSVSVRTLCLLGSLIWRPTSMNMGVACQS
ncbi:hypothetical protein DUNSADRAFT_616 [Dunaliella salina]|uniref:Uncharacterized protein n=1 Tax=Dunaliella salina TaxID=3046 RepID=A0ABQ7FYN1_DUNSA|nr:hypothetical protein DUNSADRAFT_616 [Dunaliella salina]|eukprot:KAF5827465.1 hypothetical protein DUNSADRAFT_616 [Dunaliella salina]